MRREEEGGRGRRREEEGGRGRRREEEGGGGRRRKEEERRRKEEERMRREGGRGEGTLLLLPCLTEDHTPLATEREGGEWREAGGEQAETESA